VLAALWGRLNLKMMDGVCQSAARTISMVFFIIISATCYAYVYRALGGDDVVERLIKEANLGSWGFLILVMAIVFFLGFFLDWIEITLIVLPVFAPLVKTLDFGALADTESRGDDRDLFPDRVERDFGTGLVVVAAEERHEGLDAQLLQLVLRPRGVIVEGAGVGAVDKVRLGLQDGLIVRVFLGEHLHRLVRRLPLLRHGVIEVGGAHHAVRQFQGEHHLGRALFIVTARCGGAGST
jgi:hypothetical protein